MALLAGSTQAWADVATNNPPDFKEVYDLVRAHLAGETADDLNRAAVRGLVQQLHARVSVVADPMATDGPVTGPLLAKSALYDGPIGYLRVGQVEHGLADKIASAWKDLSASNRLKGVVLDLRFADGHDYAEAAAVADLFISQEKPLLDWGKGVVRSKEKADAVSLPVAILVNAQTAAAAEALAAILRQNDRGIIIGALTAGAAAMTTDFPLKNGQFLRIATSDIKLGDGDPLAAGGLRPDIQVTVKPEDEKAWLIDPFKETPSQIAAMNLPGGNGTNAANGTNRTSRSRSPTEADLIRERKERPGMELEYSTSGTGVGAADVEKPMVHDPVLGRGLDLIKGISVIRQSRAQ